MHEESRPRSGEVEQRVYGPQHPRVVELRRLLGRRNSRSAEILLESPRTIGEALAAGINPITVIIAEAGASNADVLSVKGDLTERTEVLVVRDKIFARLADSTTPQPMLAIVARPRPTIPEEFGPDDLALVLIDVSDPGNTGTLVRVADAVGAVCVVVVGGADPWGAKAVRASAGSALRVPIVSGLDTETALGDLRAAGARIVATDVRDGEPHDSGVLNGPVAVILGSEPRGLDRAIEPLVDSWVRIDMPGRTESLNVAMAGTLLAYEASRS